MRSRGNSEVLSAKLRAAGEAAAATIVYIGVALTAVRLIDISPALNWLTAQEATVVSGFLVGSVSQITAVAVIWFALRPVDLARAVGKVRLASSAEGWYIALTIIAVETVLTTASSSMSDGLLWSRAYST